jgi:hypothetical protein
VGITEFELDLFGRVRSLSQAALQQYFAQEEARRSAQLALIAEVANAYLALAADQEQLRVVQLTLTTREEFHALTQKRYEFGAVSALDVSQSRTQVETARAEVARLAGQAAQTANALQLLVGAPVGADLLPQSFGESATGPCPQVCRPQCCCGVPTCSRPSIAYAPTMRTSVQHARLFFRRSGSRAPSAPRATNCQACSTRARVSGCSRPR